LGKFVDIASYIDSHHTGHKVIRRSCTGVLIFLNRAPVVRHSKKQSSMKTSSFESEFSAMKTGTEMIKGWPYKLRMMGVLIDAPCHVKADNLSVVRNISQPESTRRSQIRLLLSVCGSAQWRELFVFNASLQIQIWRTC